MSDHESMIALSSTPVLQEHTGVDVVLTRSGLSTPTFKARRENRVHSAIGAELGLEINISMRVYTFAAASVVLAGTTVPPQVEDVLTDGAEQFEISPPGDDKPAVELQTDGLEYEVHTKRLRT